MVSQLKPVISFYWLSLSASVSWSHLSAQTEFVLHLFEDCILTSIDGVYRPFYYGWWRRCSRSVKVVVLMQNLVVM
jgi:hypothetical protein